MVMTTPPSQGGSPSPLCGSAAPSLDVVQGCYERQQGAEAARDVDEDSHEHMPHIWSLRCMGPSPILGKDTNATSRYAQAWTRWRRGPAAPARPAVPVTRRAAAASAALAASAPRRARAPVAPRFGDSRLWGAHWRRAGA